MRQDRPKKPPVRLLALCETKITTDEIIKELKQYRSELAGIMARFDRDYHIHRDRPKIPHFCSRNS